MLSELPGGFVFDRSLGFMMLCRLIPFLLLASGVEGRVPWTSSRIQGSPEPAKPLVSEPIWAGHEIHEALEIVGLPGRVLVVENGGKIWSLPLQAEAPSPFKIASRAIRSPNTSRTISSTN